MSYAPIVNPVRWITELNDSIMGTQCEIQGESAPLEVAFKALQDLLMQVKTAGKSVWWVGNGGSQSICSHLSQDLINKLGIKSHLFSDASLLTCMANDYGYANVYKQPLNVFLQKDDLVICISSSGKSENILNVVELAKQKGAKWVTCSAFDTENPLRKTSGSVSMYVPSRHYGVVEIAHSALLHAAIEALFYQRSS